MMRRVLILNKNANGLAEVINTVGSDAELVPGYEIRQSDTLLIGMVSGGPVDAVDGFGFPEGTESREAPGAVRVSDVERAEPVEAEAEAAPVRKSAKRGRKA